jgi:hypothetical protein
MFTYYPIPFIFWLLIALIFIQYYIVSELFKFVVIFYNKFVLLTGHCSVLVITALSLSLSCSWRLQLYIIWSTVCSPFTIMIYYSPCSCSWKNLFFICIWIFLCELYLPYLTSNLHNFLMCCNCWLKNSFFYKICRCIHNQYIYKFNIPRHNQSTLNIIIASFYVP